MTDLTPNRARALAEIGYVFALPLALMYRQMFRQAIDRESLSFSGGFATWRHTPVDRGSDLVMRSSIWLDVRAEPWWYAPPEPSPGVERTEEWLDLWGMRLGGRPRPSEGPLALVASPQPVYEVPDEIGQVLRGESPFVTLRTTVRWSDSSQHAEPFPRPSEPELTPASAHTGRCCITTPRDVAWWPWHERHAVGDEFWPCVNTLLTLVDPHPDDRTVLERLRPLGVGAGRPWRPSELTSDILDAIREGMDDALSALMAAAARTSGAQRSPTRAELDRDYTERALSTLRMVGWIDGSA